MSANLADSARVEEPLAELERHLIAVHVAGRGEDLHDLRMRTDDVARRILADASRYASSKLTEIEARCHYLHTLHGDGSRG